jgi:lipoprotein-releasing system permease protein
MRLPIWLAWRYLLSKKMGRFGNMLKWVSIAGIAASMLSLVVVLSVMRGFKYELARRLIGFDSHLTVVKLDGQNGVAKEDIAQALKGVSGVSVKSFIQGEVIVESTSTGEVVAQGAKVRGVEEGDDLLLRLGVVIKEGIKDPLSAGGEAGALIGNEMAIQLAVFPAFEDVIDLVAPLADVGPSGDLVPNRKTFRVNGIFKTGLYDYDSKFVMTSKSEAKKLLGLQAEEGYFIGLDDASKIDDAKKALVRVLPEGWRVTSWNEQNKKLLAALRIERMAMGSILIMAMMISSISIAGIIFLMTQSKRKDMAILESMGAKRKDVALTFMLGAAMLGGIGAVIGAALGSAVSYVLALHPIPLPSSYYLEYLPVDLDIILTAAFVLAGIAIAVLSAVYPTIDALRYDVGETLRYE